jgi:hypothetical protein
MLQVKRWWLMSKEEGEEKKEKRRRGEAGSFDCLIDKGVVERAFLRRA